MNVKNDLSYFKKYVKKKQVNEQNNRDVIGYYRVSSKNQAENNQSLETQKKSIQKFCDKEGYNIVEWKGGTYESAKGDFSRKEFSEMIKSIKNKRNKPFGIVVFMINRFSRSGGKSISIVEELVSENRVHLIEAMSGLSTVTDRGFVEIMGKLIDSRKENLVKQEVVIPGMIAFLSKGNLLGRCPIGYDHYGPRVKNSKFLSNEQKIIINKDGILLREMFKLKSTGNYSDVEILKKLREGGLSISKQKLSRIWRNPFYCGISVNSLIDEEDPIEGKWEGLISIEEFQKLEIILDKNVSGYTHQKVEDYKPLSGFLQCKCCGKNLTGYLNKKKHLSFYKCNYCKGVSLNGFTTQRSKNVGANDLFVKLLDSFKINPSFYKLIELQLKKIYKYFNNEEIDRERKTKNKICVLEEQLKNVKIRYGLGSIDEEIYRLTKEEIDKELYELKIELNNINPKLSNQDDLIVKSLKSVQNMGEMWISLGTEDKQKLQNTLFPMGVMYDKENHTYLTKNVNSFLLVSNYISSDYEDKKNETNHLINEKSHSVAGTGLEPVTFGL